MSKTQISEAFAKLGSETVNEQAASSTQAAIMQIYAEFPKKYFTQTEIASGLGKHQGVVNMNLRKLVKQGVLVRVGKPYQYGLAKSHKAQ